MIINHNMASLNTYNKLNANNTQTSKALEKLSSGLRINRAGDDAAGLAISEKMRGQIRGLDQASRNAQDGVSLIQTAEGNLNETHSILQRMKELATQAANDTNVGVDRGEIQKEINQLSSEINRIGNTTEFNTQKLLNGGGTTKVIDPFTVTAGGKAGDISALATIVNSTAEVKGVFTITGAALATGSTITVEGQSFTVVDGEANAALGQVKAGTATNVMASLTLAFNANTELHTRFGNATSSSDVLTVTERTGQANGDTDIDVSAVGGTFTGTATTNSVKEVSGKYSISLDQAFELAGKTFSISAVVLTAANGAAGANEFLISNDREEQAKSIAAAINSNTNALLGKRFEATVSGTSIILTERAGKATGANLLAADLGVTGGAAVAGKFDVTFSSLVEAGGRITIDGNDIAVVSDVTDERLIDGKAMLAGSTLAEQATNLASAIGKNAALAVSYSATATAGKLTLTQQTGEETLEAPVITTSTTAQDGFSAKLQIGANTAQSMTVTISDMRANAIGVTSNDADKTTITTKNGTVASFVSTSNVTDGTTDTNVEYALDVSTHEKATAAISAISDAIETVSAQRSQLGAFQNRLEHTVANLGISSENLTAAESRIRDVDMAKEMMNFQKNNILSQAAQAMLAQANQQPQGVLQLLR